MKSGTLFRNLLISFLILVTISACQGAAVPPTNPTPAASSQPSIRAELVSTDPGVVEIASGKIQLVEFFAFW